MVGGADGGREPHFDSEAAPGRGRAVSVTRNVVPVGYAVFVFVLGTVTGMLVRRTLPAVAVTLVAFTALQLLVPAAVRQRRRV